MWEYLKKNMGRKLTNLMEDDDGNWHSIMVYVVRASKSRRTAIWALQFMDKLRHKPVRKTKQCSAGHAKSPKP